MIPSKTAFANQLASNGCEIAESHRTRKRNKYTEDARVEPVFAEARQLWRFTKDALTWATENAAHSFVAMGLANILARARVVA